MTTFTITFHGPFHVGTGVPQRGLDATVDADCPLPASSLKGLMRAAAEHVLGVSTAITAEVFGDPAPEPGAPAHQTRRQSPWSWTDARFDGVEISRHSRIRVDDAGRVGRGFLMLGQQVWAKQAKYDVEPFLLLDPATEARHVLVLRAAARAVTSVGAGRHRGHGWVSVADERPWTAADTDQLLGLTATEATS